MISTVSNIYLIIFLPLLSSLLCQLFNKKSLPFCVAILSSFLLLIFSSKAFFDVLKYKIIANDFELGLFSIALEFRFYLLSALFLVIMIFTKTVILLFYSQDLEKFLENDNKNFFYSSYLIGIFALIGVFLSNNLFNLFLFLEIYSLSFFTISAFSKDKEVIKSYFSYFCFNAVLSLLLLFSLFAIYFALGDFRFDKITKDVFMVENKGFMAVIFILILISFLGKFFLSQVYFVKSNSDNLVAKFLATDFLFNKTNIGIFLILKFSYEIFNQVLILEKTIVAPVIFFLSFITVLYFSFKIYKENNLKNASIYFCLSNLALMFSCIFIKNTDSLQSLFFFILNFSLVNFTFFLFSLFLENLFGNSDIKNIKLLNYKYSFLGKSFKLLLFFVISFPFTTSFFALWHLTNAAFEINFKILLIISLVIVNFAQITFIFKIINSFFGEDLDEKNSDEIIMPKFNFQALLLILLVILNFLPIFFFTKSHNIALQLF